MRSCQPYANGNMVRIAGDGGREETIIEIIRYVCGSGRAIGIGHLLADERGPRFQVVARTNDDFDAQGPMHNPFGRLKIVNAKDIAEGN